jgi:hypothetical protein
METLPLLDELCSQPLVELLRLLPELPDVLLLEVLDLGTLVLDVN